MNGHETAIDRAGKMRLDLFQRGVRMVLNKVVEFRQVCPSEGRLATLILRVGGNGTLLPPSPPEQLDPSRGHLKLLGDLLQGVLTGIISRQNTLT